MNDRTLDEQQLEALRPLAAVIEGAIKDTPIRLGTDDWGTMLAAGILVRVAAYMGGVLPPAAEPGDWLTRGTHDLSIPEQATAADEEQAQRWSRREPLLVLLTRLQRGRTLTEDEARTLREHVETEMREAETARAVAAGNLRHVKTLIPELEQAQAAIERVRHGAHLCGDCQINVAAALDGTEQPTTEPQARRPLNRWFVERHDHDGWVPASRPTREREVAIDALRELSADTTREFRLARSTTTYSVEPVAGPGQDDVWPVKESTRRHAEELRATPGQASADGHTGWECEAGASLLVAASTPGPGALGTHHGTIYACAAHRGAAVERITGAGYDVDPQPAPPRHRWNPWPCGHVTAHDADTLTALTAGRAGQDGAQAT
ncbi:MAG: hypothetical protein HOY76_36295 [Streptomyces sp.]|nr:hypothetical protein [Streptomyces sp.]NUS86808.1 hypothetical protein [Streptomyces sp.]